jgi:hypothetical protein
MIRELTGLAEATERFVPQVVPMKIDFTKVTVTLHG